MWPSSLALDCRLGTVFTYTVTRYLASFVYIVTIYLATMGLFLVVDLGSNIVFPIMLSRMWDGAS